MSNLECIHPIGPLAIQIIATIIRYLVQKKGFINYDMLKLAARNVHQILNRI